jgi:hypothetical protein
MKWRVIMKIWNVVLLTIGLGLGMASSANLTALGALNENLLVQYHFSGLDRIAADTNAQSIHALAESPATRQMREQVLRKLSVAPQQLFAGRIPAQATPAAPLFAPLWEDLFRNESCGELHGSAQEPLEWVLAVRLSDERAGLWSSNLSKVAVEWNLGAPVAVKTSGASGWAVKGNRGTGGFECLRVGSWIVAGAGTAELRATKALLERLGKQDKMAFPEAEVSLTIQSDLAGLSRWWTLPMLRQFKGADLPFLDLSSALKAGNLFSSGTLKFSHAPQLGLESWQIPTGLIRDPLISFTAVQGVHSWLKDLDWIRTLHIDNPPNQVFSWAQEFMPFMTFVAAPMNNASNAIPVLLKNIPTLIEQYSGTNRSGALRYFTNQNQVVWAGLPAVAPFVTAVNVSGREYLFCGCIPPWDSTNQPPTELFSQLAGRTNLVYYDWEITGARLSQVRVLEQIRDMVFSTSTTFEDAQRTNSFGNAWLAAAAPILGNVVTEISATSPNTWTMKRKSSAGFTAYEWLQLLQWLDDPQFPLFGHTLASPEQERAR